MAYLANHACSFDEDTPVATADGFMPIGDIEVGDRVLAWHEGMEETGVYTVTAVWAHADPVIVNLTIDGEQIETTPEHPFLTTDGQWVAAGELAVGHELRSADGHVGVVDAVEFVAAPQLMYNMTVADAHTYAVGDGQWVVHNSCSLSSVWETIGFLENGIARRVNLPNALPLNMASTFQDGHYITMVLDQPITAYRAGVNNAPLGQYFSLDIPLSELDVRIQKAVLPVWPDGGRSPLDTVFGIKLPQNTTIHVGSVAPQGPETWFFQGGTAQIVVTKPWLIPGVQVISQWPLPRVIR